MEQRIGRYELIRSLGEGAAGTVYLALDTFTEENVALKVLDTNVELEPEVRKHRSKQFMNEASLAGKLHHPHIATILDAAVDGESGYIAIEYVAGGDLSQYASPDRLLEVSDAIEVAFKCCGALDYAFRQGVVHRDLKPANILVTHGTNIKVTDFGAAYLHKSDDTQIADIGSPLYMSPEQLSSRELNQHSDMFALGVVLYELFTGRRPFSGGTLPELFQSILYGDPAPPSTLRPGLNSELDDILLRMLQKEPADRYPSWAEAALDIAEVGQLSVFRRGIPDVEKYVALRKVPLLERLSDADVWTLVHAGKWRRVPARTLLMREGERDDSLFFLGSGEVKITKQGRLLNVLGAGEYFGEMAYVKAGSIPRQASAESSTDVLVAEFASAALEAVDRNSHLQLTLALLHGLVERLALADERISKA